jgi:hypothetical protein
MHLSLSLLDLIIHAACPHPRALSIKVLRAGAFVIVTFIGLTSFTGPGSFYVLLVILSLFSGGAWNRIGVVLCVLRRCHPIL